MDAGQLVIHVTNKHKVSGPVQRGSDIHVYISTKQKNVFIWIAQSLDACEPLSYEEIGLKLNVSIGTVQHHIRRLKFMGLIQTSNTKRSIRLTEMGKVAWSQVKAKIGGSRGSDEVGNDVR